MAQSLFNFNNLTITLSAPASLTTQTIYLSTFIQGITKTTLNYNNLLPFNVNPYKIVLIWDNLQPSNTTIILNGIYSAPNGLTTPLSTLTPLNSAVSSYTYTPNQTNQLQTNAIYKIFFENGVI